MRDLPERARAGLALAVAAAPVAHPLWIADDLRVVRGNRQLAGQVVSGLRVLDPAAGPLSVVCDKHNGRRGHRGGRFDEGLHTASGPGEVFQVGRVGAVGRAVEAAGGASTLPP